MENKVETKNAIESTEKAPVLQSIEEPYFQERYPGKVCILCNLGERSQLGQGELLRLKLNEPEKIAISQPIVEEENTSQLVQSEGKNSIPLSNRRQKIICKIKSNNEYVDELQKIGYVEQIDFLCLLDSNNYYYIHRLCATWSSGVQREKNGVLKKIEIVVSQSLLKKCSLCSHFGASLVCKMTCPKIYHFPCVSAVGGLQIISNYTSFCPEHVYQAPLIYDSISCRICSSRGNVANYVMCSTCGDLYHGTCIGLPKSPGARAGWQCKSCKKCQICRLPDAIEGRSIDCEHCQKMYHANCLRPILSSIPKYGWKCRCCRICSDCGSRTPGAGASSRWHAHYTVCDSCYQQRNKGYSCPICHRAYRAAAQKEMVKCAVCNKYVHSSCDHDADLKAYFAKKETSPEYQYICPPCKSAIQSGKYSKNRQQFEEEILPTTQDSNNLIDEAEFDSVEKSADVGLGKGKPFAAIKMVKKRIGLGSTSSSRGKNRNAFSKKPRNLENSRKRGTRGKIRHFYGIPYRPEQQIFPNSDKISETNKSSEEEPGGDNRLILCSVKNKFVFSQDVCVMCGAIGTDQEGCLIACVQCGQCYHPYCVTVKVTAVILQKGWRCLDCTVCEGCGQKNDESRLLLCDECDISFHTYCMDPPLESVPAGVWKCKWCATCEKCGKNSEMVKGALKKHNGIECEPCISREICPICSQNYNNQDLIINCSACERWLHCSCDHMFKDENEVYDQNVLTYKCPLCRPKEEIKIENVNAQTESSSTPTPLPIQQPQAPPPEPPEPVYSLAGCHLMDGVYLSDNGARTIKEMQIDTIKKKRRTRMLTNELNSKDIAGVSGMELKLHDEQSNIHSSPTCGDQQGLEPMQCDNLNPSLNENLSDNGSVKKKRQRNLQKVGIGGFSVKNRQVRKEIGLEKAELESGPSKGELDRKKKGLKKRAKSKILESYPSYVQEAFFGTSLLNTENGISFESDSSDNEISQTNLLTLLAATPVPQPQPQNQPQIHVQPQTQSQIHTQSQQQQPQLQPQPQPTRVFVPDNSLDKKQIITAVTPEHIINVTKKLEFNSTPNYSIENQTQYTNTTGIINDSIDVRNKISQQSVMNFQTSLQQQSPKMEPSPSQIINLLQGNGQMPYISNIDKQQVISQQRHTQSPQLQQHQQQQPQNVQIQSVQTPVHMRNSQIDISNFSLSSNNSNDSLLSPTPSNSSIITVANVPPNKTVESINNEMSSTLPQERMRRDEELGEMATISAVLYANTRYPKLKEEYPNWPERCKQIYKFWRSLSNEAKAPFLQKARDNRSALRMKKIQQNHDRTILNHKALKEQEQERLWKLHQFRAKEQQYSTEPPQLVQQQQLQQQQQTSNSTITQVTQTSQISQVGQPIQPVTQVPQVQQINQISQISHLNQVPTQIQQQIQQVKQIQQMQQAQQVQPNQQLVQQVIQVTQIQQIQQQQQQQQHQQQQLQQQHLQQQQQQSQQQLQQQQPQQQLQQNSSEIIKEVPDSSTYQKVPYMQLQQQSQTTQQILNDPIKKTTYITNSDMLKSNKIFNVLQHQTDPNINSIRKIPTPIPNAVVFPNTNEPELSIKKSVDVEEDSDFFENIDNADDLLSSLTSDLGGDFNILEYADTDFDTLIDQGNQQLFDKLDIESDLDKTKMTQEVLSEEDLLLQTSLDPSISTNLLDIKTRLDISDNPMSFLNIITNNNVGQITQNICPSVTVPPPPYPGPPPPYPSSENKS